MNSKKTTPVSGDIEKKDGRLRALMHRVRAGLPTIAVYARYCMPLLTVLTFFVMGWFYNVGASSVGRLYRISTWRLLGNTLGGTHTYLGGETVAAKTWFYGSLSVLAILCFLFFLLALFFSALGAITAIRAFHYGHESEQSNRMKLIFKIAFPNRLCLFLSNLLILVPAAYPHLYSSVSARFLQIGGENVIFVFSNPPLLVSGIMTALSLLLALWIPRFERRREMNMFLLSHKEPQEPCEEEE